MARVIRALFINKSFCDSLSIHSGQNHCSESNCQVMEYDEGGEALIFSSIEEIQMYVRQNESDETRRRKYVREALRGLDVHYLYPKITNQQGKLVKLDARVIIVNIIYLSLRTVAELYVFPRLRQYSALRGGWRHYGGISVT